jgi:hypothetical protein
MITKKVKWREKVQLKLQVYIVFYFHNFHFIDLYIIVIYLTSSCVILAFFGMSGPV